MKNKRCKEKGKQYRNLMILRLFLQHTDFRTSLAVDNRMMLHEFTSPQNNRSPDKRTTVSRKSQELVTVNISGSAFIM